MSGPLSTNAPFSNFGQTMILRDIEQLYLLIGNANGDLGNAGYSTKNDGDLGKNAASNAASKITPATNQPVAAVSMTSSTVTFPATSGTVATTSILYNNIGVSIGASSFTLPNGTYKFDAGLYASVNTIGSANFVADINLYNGGTLIFSQTGQLKAVGAGYGGNIPFPLHRMATNLYGDTYSITFSCTGMAAPSGTNDQFAVNAFHFFITKID